MKNYFFWRKFWIFLKKMVFEIPQIVTDTERNIENFFFPSQKVSLTLYPHQFFWPSSWFTVFVLTIFNQIFRALCGRDELLKSYGSATVRLSSANTYSYEKRDITFEKYATEMMGPQRLDTLANGETKKYQNSSNHSFTWKWRGMIYFSWVGGQWWKKCWGVAKPFIVLFHFYLQVFGKTLFWVLFYNTLLPSFLLFAFASKYILVYDHWQRM